MKIYFILGFPIRDIDPIKYYMKRTGEDGASSFQETKNTDNF